ncbi:flagellar hook-associated protein FlgL [Zhongshania borealis]|uniref:Flagellar hook-associated protein FlgL n=1 Tax=Zhongshania borealis TaxID=889488 RepID=A0ABP7W814_9GAMM
MRISSSQIYATGVSNMLTQQAKLVETQSQLATGQNRLSPSDDPVGAVRSLELTRAQEKTEQYDRNGTILNSRLGLEESVVSGSIDLLQRVRELSIQANNATQSNESRQSIAAELRQQLDNLVSYANTTDSSGNYIFSGYQEGSAPISKTASGYVYNGDDGQRQIQVGPARSLPDGDPGSEVFMNILNGNGQFQTAANAANTGGGVIDAGSVTDPSQFNRESFTIRFTSESQYDVLDAGGAVVSSAAYQDGGDILAGGMAVSIQGPVAAGDEFTIAPAQRQDIFSMVEALAVSLETPRNSAGDRALQTSEINTAISNLDQAMDHLINTQATIGARMQSLERQTDLNAGASLQIATSLSLVNDLDYAEAISRFTQQQASLQAAQQAFSKVQGLSLFNYI